MSFSLRFPSPFSSLIRIKVTPFPTLRTCFSLLNWNQTLIIRSLIHFFANQKIKVSSHRYLTWPSRRPFCRSIVDPGVTRRATTSPFLRVQWAFVFGNSSRQPRRRVMAQWAEWRNRRNSVLSRVHLVIEARKRELWARVRRWTSVGEPSNNWEVKWWAAFRVERGCGKVAQAWMNDFLETGFRRKFRRKWSCCRSGEKEMEFFSGSFVCRLSLVLSLTIFQRL